VEFGHCKLNQITLLLLVLLTLKYTGRSLCDYNVVLATCPFPFLPLLIDAALSVKLKH
jgi:hypothetical protein